MTATSNKLWATAGAFALAASAVLVPMAAQAEPGDTDSSASTDTDSASSDVGSAAGRSAARTNRGGATRAPAGAGAAGAGSASAGPNTPPESVISGARDSVAPRSAPAANNTGPNPLFQNPLWWFGTPNPTPPTPAFTNTFEPLASLPGWSQSYYGWYRNLDFEACVLGLSNSITPSVGPYGTSTSSISTGGC